ncbi:MAG TPA: rhomboid family intramembrane serine protease [Deltaproteobacteria bacterium]|nr:rhomboid family intramembrane serine protease [Deltaproteobacteria bacterium]
MIPLKDNIPNRTFPIITIIIIVVNIVVFIYASLMPLGAQRLLIERYALIPREFMIALEERPELLPYNLLTIFSSMFLHGGIFHIAGNMLYLFIFGNNIEDSVGHLRFIVFYGASGLAAALMQFFFDPGSGIPMIGASGAVSGVLGAYLLLYPFARIKTLIFIFVFVTTVEMPAVVLLTVWFLMQVAFSHIGKGVAWWAHIGGFIFGLVTIKLFTLGRPRLQRAR